jgi:hypothetical protein
MSQAVRYFRALPNRTHAGHKLLVYPGGQHALNDTVAMEVDYAINAVLFLKKHSYTIE